MNQSVVIAPFLDRVASCLYLGVACCWSYCYWEYLMQHANTSWSCWDELIKILWNFLWSCIILNEQSHNQCLVHSLYTLYIRTDTGWPSVLIVAPAGRGRNHLELVKMLETYPSLWKLFSYQSSRYIVDCINSVFQQPADVTCPPVLCLLFVYHNDRQDMDDQGNFIS